MESAAECVIFPMSIACLIQTEDWDRVISHTNKVSYISAVFWWAPQHLQQVLKIQPDNVKALYRRGVSRLRLGLLDEAEEDLTAAREIDSKGKNLTQKLLQHRYCYA